jgi:transglutaminase-like putative cysteine protease
MTPHYQIPRNTLVWLFITQVIVLLPHLARVPVWVSVLIALCMAWRVQVFRGRLDFPRKSIKVVLTLLSAGGLILSFPALLGLEALVSFLFVGYGLKLLEMYNKRDALVLLYLSFFIVMTSFLFEQSMALAALNVLAVMVILTALSGLYQQDGHRHMLASFRHAAAIVLQALPLMVLMFVVLPRVSSFWNIPLNKHSAKTGMSDSMSPGDFTHLVQSADPVMRITFHGAMPPPQQQYWRGLVFSRFDGHSWDTAQEDEIYPRRGKAPAAPASNIMALEILPNSTIAAIRQGYLPRYTYDIILEETGQPWLFAMNTSLSTSPEVYTTKDFLLLKHDIVSQRFRYDVESYEDGIVDPALDEGQRRREIALPREGNPRARALAQQWRNESASTDAYIARVLDYYHNQFFYTLQPPALGKEAIDEFLFDSKKGFCEHFAGSFVFLMRAAGIPARVVVGYQGGEMNPYEHYLMVKQYDAHAWAEVWLDGKGWVRYDPTFVVAPQRILDGFHDSFEKNGELSLSMFSLDRYHNSSVLNLLRLQLDKMNYDWARWVLGYDNNKQALLLEQWLGEYSLMRIVMLFAGASVLFLLLMYAVLRWQERDRSTDPVARHYRRFCRKMKRYGFTAEPGETPQHFLQRLAREDAKRFAHLVHVATLLYQYWFANGSDKTVIAAGIRKQLHP